MSNDGGGFHLPHLGIPDPIRNIVHGLFGSDPAPKQIIRKDPPVVSSTTPTPNPPLLKNGTPHDTATSMVFMDPKNPWKAYQTPGRKQPGARNSVSNKGLINPIVGNQWAASLGFDQRDADYAVAGAMDHTGRFTNAQLQAQAGTGTSKPAHRGFTNKQLVEASNRRVGNASVPATGGATINQVAQAAVARRKNNINTPPIIPTTYGHTNTPLLGRLFGGATWTNTPYGQPADSYSSTDTDDKVNVNPQGFHQ